MSKKEDLSGITNEEELLRTFFLLEEKARSALESGSMSLQEFRRKSEIIIETMQKHLKIEHTLNDLANRIEAEQDEVEKHFFHPTYFIMFLDWTTLTFAINYKQHNRVIPNPFFKLDLAQVLGDTLGNIDYYHKTWWNRLELDISYSYIQDSQQNKLVWKIKSKNMGSLLSPPGIDPSKSWELTFDNNQDGVRSFHSQFNTIIDEMYEESLKYS